MSVEGVDINALKQTVKVREIYAVKIWYNFTTTRFKNNPQQTLIT